jgi:hypothetical protein
MQSAQEMYISTIAAWPSREQLRLASLIIDGFARSHREAETETKRQSALDILDELPGGRIFKTADEVDAYLREERDSWER